VEILTAAALFSALWYSPRCQLR